MRTLLILLLLAVIAVSILTKRGTIEGKKNKKKRDKFNAMSKKEKKRVKEMYGVSGRGDYAKAVNDEKALMKELESRKEFLKKKSKASKQAFKDVFRGYYRRNELRFDDDGTWNTSGSYGQYQDGGGKNLINFRAGTYTDDGNNIPWYEIIFNLISDEAKAKKDKRKQREKNKGLFSGWKATRLAMSGNDGISESDLETKLADYVTNSDLQAADYMTDTDFKNDLVMNEDFYKTFILTQNESGLDNWLSEDDDMTARQKRINERYDQHIRFFSE